MDVKKGLTVLIVALMVTVSCAPPPPPLVADANHQPSPLPPSSGTKNLGANSRSATTSPSTKTIKNSNEGSNFDQERLIALFGSETQPVYGNRDPTTGRVILLETGPFSNEPVPPSQTLVNNKSVPRLSHHEPTEDEEEEEEELEDANEEEPIDRKDTRVPETNEINPFELLPPQFHDLLNIPIHDYGNGTTYNPYDKYKVPSKNKYPLVSTGYANTKVQGSPSSTLKPIHKHQGGKTADAYDYDYEGGDLDYGLKPTDKPTRRPTSFKPKTTSSSTTQPTTVKKNRVRPTIPTTSTTTKRPVTHRPSTLSPEYEPETNDYDELEEEEPVDPIYHPQKPNPNHPARKPYLPPYEQVHQKPTGESFRPSVSYQGTAKEKPHNQQNPTDHENRPFYRPTDQDKTPTYNDDSTPFRPVKTDNQPFEQGDFAQSQFNHHPSSFEQHTKPILSSGQRPNYPTVGGADSYNNDDDERQQQQPFFISQSFNPNGGNFQQTGDQVAEIRVTPKPFYAADDTQTFQQNGNGNKGQVDDAPDIIYDYDDERSKGEGVLFLVDKGLGGSSGHHPNNKPALHPPVTANPVASPYPTVASRDKPQNVDPAFRPSVPIRQGLESTLFAPRPDFSVPSSFLQPAGLNLSPPPAQQQSQQNVFNNEGPRPAFRFPTDQAANDNQPQSQQPNILPLFRPNTNPTDEFQFIKHPQQLQEFQRHQLPQRPSSASPHLRQQQEAPPVRTRPSGISPLPSALQSPFSSISQAVANFFGRRSGTSSSGTQRSANLMESKKMDRTGSTVDSEATRDVEEPPRDLDMVEGRAFNFFKRIDTPFVIQPPPATPIRRSDQLHSLPAVDPSKQVVGIRANPEEANKKPPAFYVYTKHELEQGKPPYLVVGPVSSGPPNVAGARLVHTAPVTPIPSASDSQRRNDGPADGSGRPHSLNALPSAAQSPSEFPFIQAPEAANVPVRKPFFPINNNKPNRPSSGLSPPRQPSSGGRPSQQRPGLQFPDELIQETDFVVPKGIAPLSQGIAPPRVPLNPQKDVAALYSNPTLLHSRPEDESYPLVTDQGNPVRIAPPSGGLQSHLTVPPSVQNNAPVPQPSLFVEGTTPRPPKRKGPTKSPSSITTTPAYSQPFDYQQPATYSTIQQEDGKQIAVVHPAYIVTYKNRPSPPSLESLDAPFIPSVESPSEEGEMSSIPFEKWHAMHHENEQASSQDSIQEGSESHYSHAAAGSGVNPSFHGGFLPFDPSKTSASKKSA